MAEEKYKLPEDATKEEIEQTIGGLLEYAENRENDISKILRGFTIITAAFCAMTLLSSYGVKQRYKELISERQTIQTRVESDNRIFLEYQRLMHEGSYEQRKYQEARDLLDDYIAGNRISK